jgi:hypothetical protein
MHCVSKYRYRIKFLKLKLLFNKPSVQCTPWRMLSHSDTDKIPAFLEVTTGICLEPDESNRTLQISFLWSQCLTVVPTTIRSSKLFLIHTLSKQKTNILVLLKGLKKVKLSLQQTAEAHKSQSHIATDGYLLLFDSYGLVSVRRPIWREDGSVFCICCWSSPA